MRESHGVRYVEVTREDIATADRLMREILRRSLDELPPRTRRLLGLIVEFVAGREDFRFSRRDVREATQWGHRQLKLHLHRLEELERYQKHVFDFRKSNGEPLGFGRPA